MTGRETDFWGIVAGFCRGAELSSLSSASRWHNGRLRGDIHWLPHRMATPLSRCVDHGVGVFARLHRIHPYTEKSATDNDYAALRKIISRGEVGYVEHLVAALGLGDDSLGEMLESACIHGNLELVQVVFRALKAQQRMVRWSLSAACRNGHTHIADWLMEAAGDRLSFSAEEYQEILEMTCGSCEDEPRCGLVGLEWLWNRAQNDGRELHATEYILSNVEAEAALCLARKKPRDEVLPESDGWTIMRSVCETGNLGDVGWIVGRYDLLHCHDSRNLMMEALCCSCGGGQTDVAFWLMEAFGYPEAPGEYLWLLLLACDSGNLALVQRLTEKAGIDPLYVPERKPHWGSWWLKRDRYGRESTLVRASMHGHRHVVSWLLEQRPTSEGYRPIDNIEAMFGACSGGHTEVVFDLLQGAEEYLQETGAVLEKRHLLKSACSSGNQKLVVRLSQALGQISYSGLLFDASDAGLPKVVEWVVDVVGYKHEEDKEVLECDDSGSEAAVRMFECFDAAISRGHLAVAQKLVKRFARHRWDPPILLWGDNWSYLSSTISRGDFGCVIWLLEEFGKGAPSGAAGELTAMARKSNQHDLAEWLAWYFGR
jgi:hypothetical protein